MMNSDKLVIQARDMADALQSGASAMLHALADEVDRLHIALVIRNSVIKRYREGWHDCVKNGAPMWHNSVHDTGGTYEPMTPGQAAYFNGLADG